MAVQFPDARNAQSKRPEGVPTNNEMLRSINGFLERISSQLDAILWALGGPEVASINKTGYLLRKAAAEQAEAEKPRIVVPELGAKLPADGGHI